MNLTPFEPDDRAADSAGLPGPGDSPIVVVDDDASVLAYLSRVLEDEGYPVETFDSATEALERLTEGGQVALLLTDIFMPDINGIELVRRALEEDPNLAVIVLTGRGDTETAVESLRLGVEDYLNKPISNEDLVESVGRALRHRAQSDYRRQQEARLRAEVQKRTEELERRSKELEMVSVSTLLALVKAMEAKDPYLRGHSQRVALIAVKLARALGFEEEDVDDVRDAGLLHDIGMIAVPESVMHKQGQLTEEEYVLVREHVETGVGILEPIPHIARAVSYIRYHHERVDGSGYPQGLRGSDIPLAAQIIGIAEHFASITEHRPHRPAFSSQEALDTLKDKRDVWFDARVIDRLEHIVRNDPESLEAL
jgi:putative nucleotidyltransferase with HDIG domain